MAIFQSDAAKGLQQPPNAYLSGVENVARYSYTVPATGIALNDIIEMACIPAGHHCMGVELITDDLDTGGSPTLSLDVGIMSGDWRSDDQARTCGAEFFSGSTLARTGGYAAPTLVSAYRQAAASRHRSIGIKFAALAQTPASGRIDLIVRTTPA